LLQAKPFDRPTTLRALEAIERNASNQAKLIEDLKVQLNTDAGVTYLPPKSPNSGGLQSSSSPQSWEARGAKFAQITITDTGIGITADFLPYVFDRFRQAEVPSRHSPGGVGIGLAIARHLVELHGGTIEVASEGEGRGATFTVKLPFRYARSPTSQRSRGSEPL
jgi:signal transduction histidine kinase